MKIKPVHNHVVVKQQNTSEEKRGNIIIPDIGKESPLIAFVIAIGIGTYTLMGNLIPMQVKVGDKVAIPAFGGTKLTIGSDEYIVMKDQDILTIIEE